MKILAQGEYFGTQKSGADQKGISLSEYDYLEPNTPWHYHENPYFMYVMNGNMLDINKRQKSQLVPGSLIFLNWDEPHATEKHSKTGHGFHLQLDKEWLKSNHIKSLLIEGSVVLEDPTIHQKLSKIYYEFLQRDEFSSVSIEILTIELCSMVSSRPENMINPPPIWINILKEIFHNSSEELSLKDLSKQLGVHPVHISRTIPKYFGITLGEYMRRLKIKKAFPQILDATVSLSQIAHDVGFADQSHFTRTFKAYYNINPSDFRKKLLN